jgi:DNA-binding PadR family transcriptional regulator
VSDETQDEAALLAGHLQEVRRGSVVLACLCELRDPHYGYSLLSSLDELGFGVDANTLYPLLRRLEKQGLLTSEWNTDDTRPRKFYRTSPRGQRFRAELAREWSELNDNIERLLRGTTP